MSLLQTVPKHQSCAARSMSDTDWRNLLWRSRPAEGSYHMLPSRRHKGPRLSDYKPFIQAAGSSRHFVPVLFLNWSSLFLPASEIILGIVLIHGQLLCYIYNTFGGGIFSKMQHLQFAHWNWHPILRNIGEIFWFSLKNRLTSSICCTIIKMQVAFHVTHYNHMFHICQVQHDQNAKEVIQWHSEKRSALQERSGDYPRRNSLQEQASPSGRS